MSDELKFLFGLAIKRLGGELRVTEAEWDEFADGEYKLNVKFPESGETVVSLEANDMGEGVTARATFADGTTITATEESA